MDSFNLLLTPCYSPIVHGMKPEIYSQVDMGGGKGTHSSAPPQALIPRLCGMERHLPSRLSFAPSLLDTQFPCLGQEGSGVIPAQDSVCRDHTPRFLSPQAASGPRVLCIPQIILTECTPRSPSLPEAGLEELGPRTVPTPRPRTLAGSGRAWNGPGALPGLAAEVLWPRSSSLPRKELAILRSPHNAEAGVHCPWGPSPDETQRPFTAETHSEETSQNSECDTQACRIGQQAISSDSTVQYATPLRMDSLEETIQELEATLSKMGANTTLKCPSSPQPPLPSPQVAASPFSADAFLLRSLGLQSGESGAPGALPTSLTSLIPTVCVSAYHPMGACFQARAYGQSQGRPGSRPTQDSALLFEHEPDGLCPCLISVSQRIKLSLFLHPLVPLLSLTLSVTCHFTARASGSPESLLERAVT